MTTKSILPLILIWSMFFSCKSSKYFDNSYDSKIYKNAYIVDTLIIERPIGAFVKVGRTYSSIYLAEEDMGILKTGIVKIINNPNIYFSGSSFYSYFSSDKYQYNESCFDVTREKLDDSTVIFRHKSNVQKFILALININEFNLKESSPGFYQVKNPYFKSTYLKVLFPICD